MMAVLLAAALAAQQPDLRDAAAVNTLLASLRTADPMVYVGCKRVRRACRGR